MKIPSPDKDFFYHFHELGVEIWILGTLKAFRNTCRKSLEPLLDIGCGYGFWGFLIKTYIDAQIYLIGVDIVYHKLLKHKKLRIYDDLVVCDATCLPFRRRAFKALLMIELFYALRNVEETMSNIEALLKSHGLLIAAGPINTKIVNLLLNMDYECFAAYSRYLILINLKNRRTITLWNDLISKMLASLHRIAILLFKKRKIKNALIIKST